MSGIKDHSVFISYGDVFLGIFLMDVSVFFLIIPSAPTITGTVDKFKCHILAISISGPLYLESLLNSSAEMCLFLTDRIDMSV